MPNYRVETPEALTEWRTRRGWTRRRAAIWAGVSDNLWKRWETGQSRMPIHVRQRIAELNWQETLLGVATPER